ncbi:MAG: hypothetical protein WBQ95_16435 [Terracidiphilus sp.]
MSEIVRPWKRHEPPTRPKVALWQLDIIPELGLCFPNNRTSNAMAFLNLQRRAPRRAVYFLWQELTSKARRKFTFVPQGNPCPIFICGKMKAD